MKKTLLTLFGGLLLSMPTMAQEEDVTHYITNAGFDEDLTFQADGTMKEAVSTDKDAGGRSWAYIAADNTVYARPKSTTTQSRPDGRKMEAVNGFKGQISGWTMESSGTFPGCEWTYFGSVAYDLVKESVPIADDGTTYLEVPARPTEFDGGAGFVYLRAGWSNSALYKQVVKLPCAVYRLEYWTININPNTSAVAQDLTQIQCRKDVFKDEAGTGLSAMEWTKHEFEFTPTDEFTMQFGYQAANAGSGGQPIVALDGIKLYKIDEADPMKILEADLLDVSGECADLAGKAAANGFDGLAGWIGDYGYQIDNLLNEDQEGMEAGLKAANAYMETLRAAVAEMDNVDAALTQMEELLSTTDYAGKADLQAAYDQLNGYKTEGDLEKDVAQLMLDAVAQSKAAIKAYIMTQAASVDSPADFTIFIQSPWFIEEKAEPVYEDGLWVFPNALKEDGTDNYVEGSGTSPDLTSKGWYVAGVTGGDQRLNWQRGRSCWNAWNNNIAGVVAVAQDIEGLPNGYYTVQADLITQANCLNDQHVFAQSIADKQVSSSLTFEGWDSSEWETLTMTADQKVLVVDGKLTIGAEGTGTGSGSIGWFLATNFHLYYLGEAPADAVQNARDAKMDEAGLMAASMHFKADAQMLNDTIAKYANDADNLATLTALAAAMKEAKTSEAKYEEYIPADGTVDGKTIPTLENTLKKNGGDGYGAAEDIAQYAYDHVMGWAAGDTASYKYFDAQVDLVKNYVNTYIPAYNNAAETAADATPAGKAAVQAVMAEQKAAVTAEMKDKATIDEYVKALNAVALMAEKQNIYEDANATDYTAFIQNPNAEAETGWEFNKGNGNNNTTSGQWFDGSSTRYFDSYNAEGLNGYMAQQLIQNLPNGTYTVGVYTRTPAEGAYVFCAPAEEKTWLEIPMNYYQTYTDAGVDTTIVASDNHGPIWESARVAVEDLGVYTDLEYNTYNANSGKGRGWQHQEMTGIVVTNHQLLIGTAAGNIENLGTAKTFAGNWYSVGGWTLTLTAKGDNTGWEGPIASGIETAKTTVKAADGIYTLTGAKVGKLQRGVNVVITDGKARKVLVK